MTRANVSDPYAEMLAEAQRQQANDPLNRSLSEHCDLLANSRQPGVPSASDIEAYNESFRLAEPAATGSIDEKLKTAQALKPGVNNWEKALAEIRLSMQKLVKDYAALKGISEMDAIHELSKRDDEPGLKLAELYASEVLITDHLNGTEDGE